MASNCPYHVGTKIIRSSTRIFYPPSIHDKGHVELLDQGVDAECNPIQVFPMPQISFGNVEKHAYTVD